MRPTRTSSPTCPTRRAIFLARIIASMSVRDARVCCTRCAIALCAIVYTFTKLHDRRIANVGVGVGVRVGALECKLNATYCGTCVRYQKGYTPFVRFSVDYL